MTAASRRLAFLPLFRLRRQGYSVYSGPLPGPGISPLARSPSHPLFFFRFHQTAARIPLRASRLRAARLRDSVFILTNTRLFALLCSQDSPEGLVFPSRRIARPLVGFPGFLSRLSRRPLFFWSTSGGWVPPGFLSLRRLTSHLTGLFSSSDLFFSVHGEAFRIPLRLLDGDPDPSSRAYPSQASRSRHFFLANSC